MTIREFLQDSTKDTNHYICGIINANDGNTMLVILDLDFRIVYTFMNPRDEYNCLKKDVISKLKDLNIPINAKFNYHDNIIALTNSYELKYNLISLSENFKFPDFLKEDVNIGQSIYTFKVDDIIIRVCSAVLPNGSMSYSIKNPVKFKGISNNRIYLEQIEGHAKGKVIAVSVDIYQNGWEKYILPDGLDIDNITFIW